MTYETALTVSPSTVEEAMEKAFWKWAGRGLMGVACPETWTAVANAARAFEAGRDSQINALREQVEQMTVQLAGVSTAAEGCTRDPAKRGEWGWSPAYQDVLDLRRKYDALLRKASHV